MRQEYTFGKKRGIRVPPGPSQEGSDGRVWDSPPQFVSRMGKREERFDPRLEKGKIMGLWTEKSLIGVSR